MSAPRTHRSAVATQEPSPRPRVAGRRAVSPRPAEARSDRQRALLVAAAIGVGTPLLLVLHPGLAAVVSLALFVALVPLSPRLSGRLVVTLCLVAGAAGVAVVAGAALDTRIGPRAVAVLAVLPAAAAAAAVALRRHPRALLPVPDAATWPLTGTAVVAWLLTGATALGQAQDRVMGGLSALGWDHQSHFSIYVNAYTLQGVWQPHSGTAQPSFDAYPPLQGVLASWMTWLADGGRVVESTQLLTRYTQTTAVLVAVSLGLLAWVAAELVRVTTHRTGGLAAPRLGAAAGAITGGYLCFGPALSFFDFGFANFLLSAALAAAASWSALRAVERAPLLAATVVAAAASAVALLWTPLLLALVPAGAAVAWRLLRPLDLRRLVPAAGLALAALVVTAWQSRRIAPGSSEAGELAGTIGAVGGGLPQVPLALALALVAIPAIVLCIVEVPRRSGWVAALLAPAAGVLLMAGFVFVAARAGTLPQNSYYVAKSVWALYFLAIPLLGAASGLAVSSVLDALARRSGSPAPVRVGVAVGAVAVAAWASLAYVSSPATGDYLAVPPVLGGTAGRYDAFRDVDSGSLVFAASQAIGPSDAVPVIWDGGDLKQNRWLASLREQLDARADAVYNPMPGAPYLQPAVDAVAQRLREQPGLRVDIAHFRPESAALLQPLLAEFPERVRLVPMG